MRRRIIISTWKARKRSSIFRMPTSSSVKLRPLRKALKSRGSTLSCVCAARAELGQLSFVGPLIFDFVMPGFPPGIRVSGLGREKIVARPGDVTLCPRGLIPLLVWISPPQAVLPDITVKTFAAELAPGSIAEFECAEYAGL